MMPDASSLNDSSWPTRASEPEWKRWPLDRKRKVLAGLKAVTYLHDLRAFAQDCIAYPLGKGLRPSQGQVLDALVKDHFVARRGPHSVGKTTVNALAIIAFAVPREILGIDWKIPTTASSWRQLEDYLWPEVHKWWPLVRWEKLGAELQGDIVTWPSGRLELLDMDIKGIHGRAFALASNDPAKIEGAHADHLLYVIDESKTVPEETFDAIEGAFAGAGADTSQEAYALAQSTPGITAGRFYEIHQRKEGLTRWTALHTSKEQAIAEGALSAEWAEDRRLHWGERDPRYVRRVLGDFAPDDGTGVIPLSLVEAALERGKFWSRRLEAGEELPSFTCVSADIADVGQDLNVLGIRHDSVLSEIRSWEDSASEVGDPTMKASGRIVAALRPRPGGYTVIDGIGVGAGVVGRVREATAEESIDARVVPFIASRGTDRRDATGEFGFPDSRSAAWWNLREMLAGDSEIAFIVADQATEDRLTSDLTAPTWSEVSGGKIRVEPKKDIRKRLGRSTDFADVVVQAFWPPDDRAPAAISSPASVTLPRLSR